MGRLLLLISALALAAAGLFAIGQSMAGAFLPHDEVWLGMTAAQLRAYQDGRIVEFMFHDRVSFGGTLLAIAVLYAWLVAGPLGRGEPWAWWTMAASGATGFLSFLAYLGYGYLDTWHGVATLALLPVFVAGMWLTRPRPMVARTLRRPRPWVLDALRRDRPAALAGPLLVVLASFGMIVAGLTILGVGASTVFVPQDLAFIGANVPDIAAIDRGLVPLIAHDRAGFGGGLLSTGVAALGVSLFGRPSAARWATLATAGTVGFGAAIGVHLAIGYTEVTHLGPAVFGAGVLAVGLALAARREVAGTALPGISP